MCSPASFVLPYRLIGIGGVELVVGARLLAVEDPGGADVRDRDPGALGREGDVLRADGVRRGRVVRSVLAHLEARFGREVHDEVGLDRVGRVPHLVRRSARRAPRWSGRATPHGRATTVSMSVATTAQPASASVGTSECPSIPAAPVTRTRISRPRRRRASGSRRPRSRRPRSARSVTSARLDRS